ncbi:MFS transporter [Nisaea acidiphila]|uniref:MFS transporter n=1 Tax=Nisaea acidiphila TaxID=1862145 RepID=A0A9J7AWN1_9PROT|nr:MFS transporter [Nisaea acidiphila]UUX49845.1 MFS transporter [Nisaea acidiphila]
MTRKWRNVALLTLCEVLAMTLWFSGSAIIPGLRAEMVLSDAQAAAMASAVSFGFVAGTLVSAVLTLADRVHPQRLFMISALAAAGANLATFAIDPAGPWMPVLRFVVGACMAGIYPVGMIMMSSWTAKDRGLLVGILVAALTLGSGAPHLIDIFGGLDWRFTIAASSALAAAGGLLVLLFEHGRPFNRAARFKPAQMLQAWTDPSLRYASFGYFGHMVELYAVWAWIALFLASSLSLRPDGDGTGELAKLLAFTMIGSGAAGSILGGLLADRIGRTRLTMACMTVSGFCCLVAGFVYGMPVWVLVLLCVVWGISIIADSAQFSASVIELAPPDYAGTMVTTQTCIGFTLTVGTIHAVPWFVDLFGWEGAFVPLAAGPFLGVLAMAKLRALPQSRLLAHGRR